MGGIVDSVVDVFDVATFGLTGVGAVAGNDVTGTGGFVKDSINSVFGEEVEASDGLNPFVQESSLGTTGFNPATGKIVSDLSEPLQGLFDTGLEQAGAFQSQVPQAGAQAQELSSGFLSEVGAFDPFTAAEEQFNRLDAILEPGRTKSRTGTAAGLLSTGRLGGTTGNDLQASVEGEIENQRQLLLNQQFTEAQGVQDSLVNRGTSLGAFGQQEQLTAQGLSTGALNNALGIDAQLQSQVALGSNLTKTGATAGQQSGFDSILQGAATAGLASLI